MMLMLKKLLTYVKTSSTAATKIRTAWIREAAGLQSSLPTASSCSWPRAAPWWFSAVLTMPSADAAPLGFWLLSALPTSVSSSRQPFGDLDLLASFARWTSPQLSKETWKMKLEIAGPMKRMDSSSSLSGFCKCLELAAAVSKVWTCPRTRKLWSEVLFPKFEGIDSQLSIDTRCFTVCRQNKKFFFRSIYLIYVTLKWCHHFSYHKNKTRAFPFIRYHFITFLFHSFKLF